MEPLGDFLGFNVGMGVETKIGTFVETLVNKVDGVVG